MEAEVFYSEFFRVTHLTRKRMIHNQLMSLSESPAVFTVGEQASIYARQVDQRSVGDMTIAEGIEALKNRLWRIRRGE